MNNGLDCLAVIPARGASKRVPGKNIKNLLGKPAIAYTLEAAIESGLFARIVVSTDSESIAEIALRYDAEVPFLRASELADDHTPVSLVTLDVLERLDPDANKYFCVAQLMANCPLRTAADIRASYQQFRETDSESQISLTRFGWQNPWWAVQRADDFTLESLFETKMTARSQDLPSLFCPTGAIWWAQTRALRREGTFHFFGRTGWEIPWMRGIDIDTEDDWQMAEVLMRLGEEVKTSHVG
ncbi:MAG TPA: acylneuraminate cytidylyltransferase family protein [Pyrinomonadaceae bacterium]|nr:acylneuraminate cytidylyltransferase family protein [Pyrinomonadaceae bacterium]